MKTLTIRRSMMAAALAAFGGAGGGVALAAPSVVTDIAPVHALAARVMQGVGEPALILPPGASPHGYALRPSEAARLAGADLIFWVGPELSPWFGEAAASLAPTAGQLALRDAAGVVTLPLRTGATFDGHDHDHHAHHGDAHTPAPAGENDHGHHGHQADANDHGHDHGHARGDGADHGAHAEAIDEHLWLDPVNARAWAAAMATALSAADPANAKAYVANAQALDAELAALTEELTERLAPAAGAPFVVFHDAYQYFENRFGLSAAGSISLSDASSPGAARVAEVRDRVRALQAVCVFSEPQFNARLVEVVIEGANARTAELDPLGVNLTPGPELYADMLRGLADSFADCLIP